MGDYIFDFFVNFIIFVQLKLLIFKVKNIIIRNNFYMSRVLVNESTTTKTSDWGEVIEETTSKSFVIKKEEEPFFLTYVKSISWIYNIKSILTLKLLYKLLELSDYNKNTVRITSPDRQELMNQLDTSPAQFTRALKDLETLGIISGVRGLYTINPSIYWKGDKKTREELIKKGIKITIEPNIDFDNEK